MTSYVKQLRDSRAAQSDKLRKIGAQGSLRWAKKAEHAPRQYNDARARYADGGAVGDIGGMPSKPRLDRPGRMGKLKGKGKGDKKGTNVNVIVMPKGDAAPVGPKPDMAGPPMGGPPMPPPGAGGPPMPPMRASGGRIANLGKYAHGGKVKREDGGRISEDSKREVEKLREGAKGSGLAALGSGASALVSGLASRIPGPGKNLGRALTAGNLGFGAANLHMAAKQAAEADRIEKGRVKEGEEDRKSGGRVHSEKTERADDEAQDKKMVATGVHKHEKAMHKGAKLTKFRKGGKC